MRKAEDFLHLEAEVTAWRRHIHSHPELDFDVQDTARFVCDKLESFGIDHIETGIGGSGVIALIEGGLGEGSTIALRADMDALPIQETTKLPWASRAVGKMHACGDDGHTAMLLGAAK